MNNNPQPRVYSKLTYFCDFEIIKALGLVTLFVCSFLSKVRGSTNKISVPVKEFVKVKVKYRASRVCPKPKKLVKGYMSALALELYQMAQKPVPPFPLLPPPAAHLKHKI